ncbi:YjzD family protein [Metabacillus iocasae]|uniref:DUF2929 domain-containing protein n=1 Tax=Priestia iocasae TaxID=2291674 RepID=A0ABS2QV29_9BACI|nr:YjzD family protein [Metabacillus iocasae]MBM7702586.1 hypothetical protein [Metabacillus iocasae]
MRFFWTFFWGFLLINMAAYVISSMAGGTYDFAHASIVSVIFSLVIILLGEVGVPNEPIPHDHH